MAIDKSIYTPLYDETSLSEDSEVFYVAPGEVAFIKAFGFLDTAEKTSETDLTIPQAACLDMLMFEEAIVEPDCNHPFRLDNYITKLLAREAVNFESNPIMLTSCCNVLIINIPGYYCFRLNDPSAIGEVSVYMNKYSHAEFPWISKFMIGE